MKQIKQTDLKNITDESLVICFQGTFKEERQQFLIDAGLRDLRIDINFDEVFLRITHYGCYPDGQPRKHWDFTSHLPAYKGATFTVISHQDIIRDSSNQKIINKIKELESTVKELKKLL